MVFQLEFTGPAGIKEMKKVKNSFNPSRSFVESAIEDFKRKGGLIQKELVTNDTKLVGNIDGQTTEFLRELLYFNDDKKRKNSKINLQRWNANRSW